MIVGWLVQRVLMLSGGFFAAHGISVTGTLAEFLTGCFVALVGVVLSWFGRKKALNMEPPKPA